MPAAVSTVNSTQWRNIFAAKFDASNVNKVLDALFKSATEGDVRAITLFLQYADRQVCAVEGVEIDYEAIQTAEDCMDALRQIARAEVGGTLHQDDADRLSKGVQRMADLLRTTDPGRKRHDLPVTVRIQTIAQPKTLDV